MRSIWGSPDLLFGFVLIVIEIVVVRLARRLGPWLSGPFEPPPLVPRAEPQAGYRAPPEDDERPTVHDLAFMLGNGAFAALCGMFQRGIVDAANHRLVRGHSPLPSDAAVIEERLYPAKQGVALLDAMAEADAYARPFYEGRLREWGLLVRPWVDRAARFCVGCVALTPVALAVAKYHAGTATPVMGVVIVILVALSYRALGRGRLTTRGRRLADEVTRQVRQLDLREWPDPTLDHETVVAGAAVLGPLACAGTKLRRMAVAVLGYEAPSRVLARIPGGDGVTLDTDLFVRQLSRTPENAFAALRRRLALAIALFGALLAAAFLAAGSLVDPVPDGRRGHAWLSSSSDMRDPVPAPRRGRDVMDCAGTPEERAARREAKAEQSVFALAAQIDERRHPREPVEPDFTKRREHGAAPGAIFAISASDLHPVRVRPDGSVTVERVPSLEVRLPQPGVPRDFPSYRQLAPDLHSITIDRFGSLFMFGDGRLYQCSPDTSICFPRGVLPLGTKAVFTRIEPERASFIAVDQQGTWGKIETLNPSGFLADAMIDLIATTELCVDALAVSPADPTRGIPTRGADGRLYATAYEDGHTIVVTVNPENGAITHRLGPVSQERLTAAILALPDQILVFSRHGGIWRYEPDTQTITYLTHAGTEIMGVAAYFDPTLQPD